MTARSPFRRFVCVSILILTLLTSTLGVASARMPLVDAGGPGGGGGVASGTLDETARAIALGELSGAADTAVLVGSTAERETVAHPVAVASANPTLSPIAGSEAAVVVGAPAFALTANAHSIQLVESKNAPGGILAGIPAPPARVAYADSEHAVAQNREALAVVQPTSGQPY